MGTRAVTKVVDEKGDLYVTLYRQFDGYPSGHGKELAEWLEGAEIGNGIRGNEPPGFFNGVEDLACRLVTFFRQDHRQIGGFYVIPPGSGWYGEYIYTVIGVNPGFHDDRGDVTVKVDSYNKPLFSGTVEAFRHWVDEPEED